jgi:phenylacetate-CoA ligase
MAPTAAYELREIETTEPEAVQNLQLEKLRSQLDYVQKNSAFYQTTFAGFGFHSEDIKSLKDLAELPFTTKEDIRASQADYPPLGNHVAASMESIIRIHSSSGTTGTPSFAGITRKDREIWTEITARSLYAKGVRPDDILIHAVGLTFFVGGLPVKDAVEHIGATFVPVGTGASDRVVTTTRLLKANVLHCTPSYAIYLADYCRNKLKLDPQSLGFKKIVSGAEPGAGIPSVREMIQEDYDCILTEGMGNGDIAPIIFGECPQQQGMHFCAPEYIICELIDPETGTLLPFEDGIQGELVYTHIDRECCPLIRFRSRDMITVWTGPCECGRTGFRIRCTGRSDDMLIILGVNIFPSAIKDVVTFFRPRMTGEIQILLEQPGPKVEPPLKIRAEYAEPVSDPGTLKSEIEQELRQKLVFRAEVELVPEGTLPRFEAKAQLIKKLYEIH